MARVTVDDSLRNVKNRFELVLLAAKRARDLTMAGIEPEVDWDNDKPTVVALREIAANKIKPDYLYKKLPEVKFAKPNHQTIDNDDADFDFDEDSNAALIAGLTVAVDEAQNQSADDFDDNEE